jgi:ssDNA-binding Zn-finger/Zn-ribbon topoisomerase 1
MVKKVVDKAVEAPEIVKKELKMRTITEHNQMVRQYLRNASMPSGIACDKCGTEMVYVNYATTARSRANTSGYGSQHVKRASCPNCRAIGEIIQKE